MDTAAAKFSSVAAAKWIMTADDHKLQTAQLDYKILRPKVCKKNMASEALLSSAKRSNFLRPKIPILRH